MNRPTKLTRNTPPPTCGHCGGPLPSAEEQGHRPGALSYYCTPIRVYHPPGDDGTPGKLWMKIPSACERDRANARHILAIDPADLTPIAAEILVRRMVAWVQRTREHHLLPGSKRRTKLLVAHPVFWSEDPDFVPAAENEDAAT